MDLVKLEGREILKLCFSNSTCTLFILRKNSQYCNRGDLIFFNDKDLIWE